MLKYAPSPQPSLVVTSSTPLIPPTPSLRQAEFFTSIICHGNVVLASLWIGVLSCIDIELEKDKDVKRRRSSVAKFEKTDQEKRLVVVENFNIK